MFYVTNKKGHFLGGPLNKMEAEELVTMRNNYLDASLEGFDEEDRDIAQDIWEGEHAFVATKEEYITLKEKNTYKGNMDPLCPFTAQQCPYAYTVQCDWHCYNHPDFDEEKVLEELEVEE